MTTTQRQPEQESMNGIEDSKTFGLYAQRYLQKGYTYVAEFLFLESRQGACILDLGTGTGNLLQTLLQRGEEHGVTVYGADLSVAMIRLARTSLRKKYPSLEGRSRFIITDAQFIAFEECTFDAVASFASLHHWDCDITAIFKEIHRILLPGGKICIGDLKRSESSLIGARAIPSKLFARLFVDSVRASYTPAELGMLLEPVRGLFDLSISEDSFALFITGTKK